MDVNIIVAAGKNGAIGRRGDLVWHISSDLKRFKTLTMGHPVIMGRKTWESLPKRPLPGRRNIVVSRNPEFEATGAEVVSSPEEALRLTGGEEVFIMGGAQLYEAFFPLATRVYLTEIDADCSDADAFIEFPLNPEIWQQTDTSDPYRTPDNLSYRYVTYKRK
ncbi:MAG: dihydrofolate reductase [Bacteroides sp.]|nr:dihydrofolate reductase [Bacteroides sp.]